MRLVALPLILALAGCAADAAIYHPVPVAAGIPPGHMPPPGSCRIWFPDRPPGHQPPPGPCGALYWQVPPGAILVQG